MSYPYQGQTNLCLTRRAVVDLYQSTRTPDEFDVPGGFELKSRVLGNPILRSFKADMIVPVQLPGLGPQKNLTLPLAVNRRLAQLFRAAFEKLLASRIPYVIHDVSTYLFRYKENPSVKAAIANRPEYAHLRQRPDFWGRWNRLCAEHDREQGTFEEAIPYGRGTRPKKELLSNHSWGSAIDINSQTNPNEKEESFDMPLRVVEIMEGFGFHWGGYYHDYMHFEFGRTRIVGEPDEEPSQVRFPFGVDQRRESPLKYYFFNETGSGGYFPLGKQRNLHGGVHLEPDVSAPLVPVKAAMPGYIVAARMMPPGKAGNHPLLLQATEGRPLGFVLVRHELSAMQDGQPARDVHPLYSLYMHLTPPQWGGAASDREFEQAPWLAAFLKLQHGAVVNLKPLDEDVGKTFWAQGPLNPEAAEFKVRDRTAPLKAKSGERSLALLKPSPATVRDAIEALQKGSIVTFDRPLFPVAAGETLGFLAPGLPVPQEPGTERARTTTSPPRYLHWELFSPSGSGGGLDFLAGKDKDLKNLLLRIQEHKKDNFLEMPSNDKPSIKNEVNTLFGSTGVDIVQQFRNENYGNKLQAFFNDGQQFFSARETRDTPFTWPLRLTLNNKYKYPGAPGRPCILEVLYKKAGQPLSKEVISLSPRGQSTLEVTLTVPAAADALALWSQDFFTDAVELPQEELRRRRKESRLSLFKQAMGHRWRNVVLDHLNEWTVSGLELQLQARDEAGLFDDLRENHGITVEDLKKLLRPLSWWGRPATRDDPFGEVPVLGAGQQSLFGAGERQLPENAQLVNMHPVTALWLIDLLLETGDIALRKEWPPAALKLDESNQQPPYLGLLSKEPVPRLGTEMVALLVQHGYGTTEGVDSSVSFWLAPREGGDGDARQEPRLLCRARYTDGVAKASLRLGAWGPWEIYATGEDGQRMAPAKLQGTTLELSKPELTGQPFTLGSKPATPRPKTTGAFVVRDHWPLALPGYVVLDYWKAPARGQPDLTQPPLSASLAIPILAERPPAERTVAGLKFDQDFIVGRQDERKSPKVTPDFSFNEFVFHKTLGKVFEGNERTAFKLAMPLAQRLQELRDLCKPPARGGRDLQLVVKRLSATGHSLLVGPSSGTAPNLQLLAAKLPSLKPSELFTAELVETESAVRLTYHPPTTSTGPLQFEFDPAFALGRLAMEVLSQPGETLHVRPRFIVPNGGHALHETGRLPPVEGVADLFTASAEQLKAACGNGFLEVVADRCLPPVARFAFGAIEVKMGAGRLRTEVRLDGDAHLWSAAAPVLKLSGASQNKRQGALLQADWPLMNHNERIPAMWSGPLKFSAEVTQPDKVTAPPPPVTLEVTVEPKLEPLTHEVRGKNLWLTGQGRFIPTDADLRVTCERLDAATGGWVADAILDGAVRYKTEGDPQHGRCTDTGLFEASIPVLALKKTGASVFRFTWRRRVDRTGNARPVLGVVIAETSTEITAAQLGL